MFKIKVGLKSFQTHSIEKCKHQIGRIVDYLKRSPASFSMFSEKDYGLYNKVGKRVDWKEVANSSIPPLVRKRSTTLIRRPSSSLPPVKEQLQSCLPTLCSSKCDKEAVSLSHFELQKSLFDVVVCLPKLNGKRGENTLTFVESGGIMKRGSNSRSILDKQVYFRDPTIYKEGISRTRICKMRGPLLRKRLPCNILESKILFLSKSKREGYWNNSFLTKETDNGKKVWNSKKSPLLKGFLGVAPLPTLVKKMTTLRSPHIDKKSREQFEWKREKTQIDFHLNSVPQISLVLFILTHSRFPGVEIEISVESKTYFA